MHDADRPSRSRRLSPLSASAAVLIFLALTTMMHAANAADTPGAAIAVPASPAPSEPGPLGGAPNVMALIPHDLSPWSMFMNADTVVKAVMVGLALASFATWTIFFAKNIELFGAKRHATAAIGRLFSAATLTEAADGMLAPPAGRGAVARLVAAAVAELRRSPDLPGEGIKERLAIALSRQEARAGRDIAIGTGLLATIGSTAPFIGLFGTVWGIMNAFIGISRSHTTNLAVVAPGIAEALLATACGLMAAIPAVMVYNSFTRSIAGYRALLSDASAEILQHVSRDLDRLARAAEAWPDRAEASAPPPPPVRLRSGA